MRFCSAACIFLTPSLLGMYSTLSSTVQDVRSDVIIIIPQQATPPHKSYYHKYFTLRETWEHAEYSMMAAGESMNGSCQVLTRGLMVQVPGLFAVQLSR